MELRNLHSKLPVFLVASSPLNWSLLGSLLVKLNLCLLWVSTPFFTNGVVVQAASDPWYAFISKAFMAVLKAWAWSQLDGFESWDCHLLAVFPWSLSICELNWNENSTYLKEFQWWLNEVIFLNRPFITYSQLPQLAACSLFSVLTWYFIHTFLWYLLLR